MPRLPLLFLAILALLGAIWAGLLRIGWGWASLHATLATAHGPLMVSAFLGTVISLERAVALETTVLDTVTLGPATPDGGAGSSPLRRRAAYLVPALSALGGLLLLTGLSWMWAGRLLAAASVGLVFLFALIVRRHPAIYTVTMALGAVAWLGGNLLAVAGRPLYAVAPWWIAFLVLTIAGERLELSRVLRLSRGALILFSVGAGLLVAGVLVSLWNYGIGVRLVGLGLLGLSVWLLFYDIARRNLRRAGLTRYIAYCLFGGYFWLATGGALWLVYGGVPAGPIYDAILHSVFLGFVFAMIFGHAPLIFPAILSRPMAYSPIFYLPLIALHLTLTLRLVGDLLSILAWRQWGGLLNGVTLLLFLLVTVMALWKGHERNTADRRPFAGDRS